MCGEGWGVVVGVLAGGIGGESCPYPRNMAAERRGAARSAKCCGWRIVAQQAGGQENSP